MELEEKFQLISSVGEEILTPEELRELLSTTPHPIAYDGFEPSGAVHIAQGLLRAINVNKLVRAGCHFKMFVADWHAWANHKMGGDLERIRRTGKLLIEIWRACGMDLQHVEFVWASDLVQREEYWKTVLQVGIESSLERILRTTQIMGRSEKDRLSAAQILYPCMQTADIFHLGARITQLGMDQRKVNVLARELGPKLGFWKPVVVSHALLPALTPPPAEGLDSTERAVALKMSKSHPSSALFMTDPPPVVDAKIEKAYCPPKTAHENPILEYLRRIVFELLPEVEVDRPAKFGGPITYTTYGELERDYLRGALHPQDLKRATARALNTLLDPVRLHLESNPQARSLREEVEEYQKAQGRPKP